jgi:probable F420-dependent oxidoreductase
MPKVDLGPFGAVVSPGEESFVDTARALESLGFSTIWLTGGPLSRLDQVRDVVTATRHARVATGIISVDRFPAEDVVELYTDLERDHPGRFVPGFGGAHGSDPFGTLNRYLDRIEEAIPPRARVLAALGPRMMRLARDRAAGAFPVLVTTGYTEQARAIVGPDTTLAVNQLVTLETDPATARRIAHGPLDFLGKLPGYQASFRRQGFSEGEVAQLSDSLVDTVVAWGDAAAISARVDAHRQAGADHIAINVVSAGPTSPLDQWRALAEALIHS